MYAPTLNPDLPVHPTFFYEFLATLLIFVILIFVRKRSKLPYATVAVYCILYGIARFFIEGLRTDSLYIADTGLRSSQVLSAVLVVVGFGIIAVVRYLGLKRVAASDTEVIDPAKTGAAGTTDETSGNSDTSETNRTSKADEAEDHPEISEDKDISTDGGDDSIT